MNLFEDEMSADEILEKAITEHSPSHVFGLFSGGNDSLTACHLASRRPEFSGCFHANTGIGIEKTRVFVRETCRQFGWQLEEIRSPMTYEWFVANYGFPGPSMHSIIYSYLKERCVRQLVAKYKQSHKDRIMLVGGVRKQESRRRMGYDNPISLSGCQLWVSPILYWSKEQCDHYISENDLPVNMVSVALGMSGECCCGAYAGSRWRTPEAELDRISVIDPSVRMEIERLTKIAKDNGKPCRWGYPPEENQAEEQREMLELQGQTFMPLCSHCQLRSVAV